MKIEHGIICTTHLMRDNSRLTKETLKSIVDKINKNSLPLTVDHDRTIIIGILDQAEIVQLEDGEFGVKARIKKFTEPREYRSYVSVIKQDENKVEPVVLRNDKIIEALRRPDLWCDVLDYKNIIEEYYPEIVEKFDKNSLLPVTIDMNLRECGIFYKEHILLYHPYFRRVHSKLNNFNTDFIQNFVEVRKKDATLDMRIMIDPDLLGFVDTFHGYMELDYWHGPKLMGRDFSSLKDGVTVHGRGVTVEGWSQILKTEFYTYTQDNVKTIQIEEVRDEPVKVVYEGNDVFASKYVHAQYDLNKKAFIHLGGAIRVYTVKSYEERKYLEINKLKNGPINRIKLFLIQSELNYDDWIKLVHFFFRNNPHIPEFFS